MVTLYLYFIYPFETRRLISVTIPFAIQSLIYPFSVLSSGYHVIIIKTGDGAIPHLELCLPAGGLDPEVAGRLREPPHPLDQLARAGQVPAKNEQE